MADTDDQRRRSSRRRREAGITSVEYLILLTLVVLTDIAAFSLLGQRIRTTMTQANSLIVHELRTP